MKIYAPNKYANGVYASVHFTNGVGETDNQRLIEWFESHGYTLEKCEDCLEKSRENVTEPIQFNHSVENDQIEPQNDEIDFESMTPNDLRQWAMEHGYGNKIRNTRNKAKLLEIIRG